MRSTTLALLSSLAAAGCDTSVDAADDVAPDAAPMPEEAALMYPSFTELYGEAQGMYRGCSPNGGVCHNGKEFPNFASIGAILDNIDQACNQGRNVPEELHDLCERPGDLVRIAGDVAELAYFEPMPAEGTPLEWRVHLSVPVPDPSATGDAVEVVRWAGADEVVLWPLDDFGVVSALDPEDPTGKTLRMYLPEGDIGNLFAYTFATAGVPGDPSAISLGDPNRNGIYGATLGGRLIKPGSPELSYLMVRLTDPTAGPVMPRANCCYWTKTSLRALWCWIASLDADGGNALDSIDYDSCPTGPFENIVYPEPGPDCEVSGMCPVQTGDVVPDDPSWSNVYGNILRPNCGGGGVCHADGTAGNLDMRTEDSAWRDVSLRIVPGDAAGSRLIQRLDPDVCQAPTCVTMPLGKMPLDDYTRGIVEEWIAQGATRQ